VGAAGCSHPGATTWHLEFIPDFRERILARRNQRVSLARYGRIPPSTWDDQPTFEIDWAMKRLSEMLEQEPKSSFDDLEE
jgi:hypothetical protein